jgi:hypothetical protein
MAPPTSVFVSVEDVLTQQIQQYQDNGATLSDFNVGSVVRNIGEAVGIAVSNQSAVADQLNLDAYLDTATGLALDALAANWLVTRLPAVQATGSITITRGQTTAPLTLTAGWIQLASVPSGPGTTGVTVVTTADANFSIGQAAVTVTAQAVVGGVAGNLSASTYVIPLSPVSTIVSSTGYEITTAFTGGVDPETDDALRARIPLDVQGAVCGRWASFMAAALGVPGVLSAGVIQGGGVRADASTVLGGMVEVYYQGSSGLLPQVASAVANAATLDQDAAAYCAATSVGASHNQVGQKEIDAVVTAFYLPGTNYSLLWANILAALQAYVNSVGLGGNTLYQSAAIEAMLAVDGVVSLTLPLTKLCLHGGAGCTDLVFNTDQYPDLATANAIITVTAIP